MMNEKRHKSQTKVAIRYKKKGIALITSVGLMATMSVLGLTLMTTSLVEIQSAERFESRLAAFHWAEGAVDQTIAALRTNPLYQGVPNTAVGNGRLSGSYQTTVTRSGLTNIYQIAAVGTTGSSSTSSGYQERNLNAYVELPSITPPADPALFANTMLAMSGTTSIDAYDSRQGLYSALRATNEGHVGTNSTRAGFVMLSGRVQIKGNLILPPGTNPATAVQMSPPARIWGERIVAAERTTHAPVRGYSCTTDLSISGQNTVTLDGGTHVFKNISISGGGRLNFRGPATVIVTGQLSVSGDGIGTADNLPPNLRIKVQGPANVNLSGSSKFYGAIYAPQSQINISGGAELFGSFVGNVIAHSGSGHVHYDKALTSSSGGSVSTIQMRAWSET